MTAIELLSHLSSKDIEIWADGDRLRYNAPKGALTPNLRKELAAHKSEILTLLRKADSVTSSASFPLKPVSRAGDLPLSFAQKRLWFLDQLEPNSPLYNIPRAVWIAGPLNIDALQSGLDTIIGRHEALRTRFAFADGSPVQVIAEHRSVELPVIDLSELSAVDRRAEVKRLCAKEARRPFDLSSDLMMRARLYYLDKQEHVLLLVIHHIASDGWSMGVLFRELSILYEAFAEGKPCPLPELAIQYADFAIWQRQWLQGEVLETQLGYWKQQLQNAPPVLDLSMDHPRPLAQTYRGARKSFSLRNSLVQGLKALSHNEGATLYMTLLAAFKILLRRYTAQDDIIIGSPIANRDRREIEGLIGFFVNTLVMRTDLSRNVSFRELLARVRKVAIEAYANQEIPFEKLLEELQPERNFSHSPLFQIMFVLQNAPEYAMHFSGLTLSPMDVEIGSSKFDLELSLEETTEGINGLIEYNSDLFDSARIARMIGHFQTLLESIVENPDQRISDMQMLTDTERRQMLVDWNDTSNGYPHNICIHQLFEQQVEQTPDAVAIVYGDEQLTYRELNARANQLAHYLISLGAGPETLVGLYMERSLEMVVGIYGILKAGGAYVPLDPEYPSDRVAYMIEDTEIPVLLTQARLLEYLPQHMAKVICLDADWSTVAREKTINTESDVAADDIAYVIFTSGSTGKPKGVMNEHRGICNRILWMQDEYGLTDSDRVLQKTPFSFDVSVWEFFWPLLVGARLIIARPEGHRDSAYLVKLIVEQGITTLHFVPSMLQIFLEEKGAENCRSLKRVICSGEVLPYDLQNRFFERLDVELHNLYGPTEAAVDVSFWPCQRGSELPVVPIGFPVANTQLYVLDAGMQPVPIGVSGELHIGGVQVARGYLNRPNLTAERFISDPFNPKPGARLYKTGDLARYLSNGAIEYIGRTDFQVKIRGLRIELREIEMVLSQHPDVQDAVVVVREDPQGEKRLVGYLVSAQEVVSPSELRQHLKQTLPKYMVPATLMKLDALPLTPNGKVDRQALPVPDGSQIQVETDFVAPRSPYEDAVAEFWRDSLGLEQVGIYDNFFDLGGHSLLATKIVSRLKTTFAVDLPLRAFFDSPTIAELSATLAMARQGEKPTEKVGILPVARNGTLPLSFAQERFWVLDQFHANRTVFNVSYGFRLRGPFQLEVFRESVQALADRHEILRTTFASVDDGPHQVIAPTLSVEVPLQSCSGLSNEEQAGMIQQAFLEERCFQFDLAHGPLFRARLLRFAEDDHFLVLNLHHIIHDAWSLEVIIKDLVTAYTAGCAGHAVTLPALPIQYVDYAHWQRELLKGPIGREQLSFWKTQLAQFPPALPLPTDYARPAVQTFRGARERLQLSAELLAPLRALNRQEGTTLFMVLLATLQLLLHRLTGTHDILVGSLIAGRDQQELHGLIGCFLNTLVLRTDLSDDLTVRGLLQRVREVVLNAYENQDVPFEKVLTEVDVARDLSRTPIFQVLLNMHSFDDQHLPLPELSVTRVHSTDINSLFDMTLYFYESTDEIKLSLVYNADLFTAERMTEFVRQFQSILEQMINDPDQRIFVLSLLTEAERHQILVDWNDTAADYPDDKWIHTLFETQAAHSPEAVAVIFGDEQLSYHELNCRANQLAHYLRKHGVGSEQVVGICMERSLEMIIGLFAILKAGGAYVALEPDFPGARLSFMLEDTKPGLLLTQERLLEELPEYSGEVACLDLDGKLFENEQESNLELITTPEDLAYVTYTSGSTGRPKGILTNHRNVVQHLHDFIHRYSLSANDIVLQIPSFSFDASVRDIFGPLMAGARIVVVRNDEAKDPSALVAKIAENYVTCILSITPSLLTQLVEAGSHNSFSFATLRHISAAGEPLPMALCKRVQDVFGCSVVNQYGPTECTIISSYHRVVDLDGNRNIALIGRPIANTQFYILDDHLNPVPVGVAGEAYIGGLGVSKGYLKMPDLTAEKFIPNPFSNEPGARLYKTGDMVRYMPDGTMEFLGRRDFQVKIRGVRIELGEVEATLCLHPSVSEAVVVAREDRPGDKRLVAYVVAAAAESAPSTGVLRAFLQEKLPDYMIPSVFVSMEALPLIANRKVDRRALPVPDERRPDIEESFAAPRNAVEEALAEIWGEVLRIEKVGIQDNFFELGGHSLMATQIISRLTNVFQVEIPLRQLFLYPTIAELALIIDGKLEKTEQENVIQLLDEFEDLSDEEAERLLTQELRQNERANRLE